MPPEELLDAGVRQRLAALRRPEDRARHATGAALSDALAREHGGPGVRVVRRRGERPVVDGAELSMSVAHGGAWVVVAVTALAPVGVDVEPITRELDVDALAGQILAPAERDVLDAVAGEVERRRALLTWWTRKEAVLKATGDGLRIDPRDVVLSPPGVVPRLVAFAGRPELVGACAMADLAPDEAHVGAVAVLAPEPVTLARRDGAALLGLR
jgi:4'-phosphopantetheinyl transferase